MKKLLKKYWWNWHLVTETASWSVLICSVTLVSSFTLLEMSFKLQDMLFVVLEVSFMLFVVKATNCGITYDRLLQSQNVYSRGHCQFLPKQPVFFKLLTRAKSYKAFWRVIYNHYEISWYILFLCHTFYPVQILWSLHLHGLFSKAAGGLIA